MNRIIYYVATSLDGFISGFNEDVSNFIYQGEAVNKYLEDLNSFSTVMMGRNTYEFGYRFGAEAGQPSPAYPHMKHYIFSNSLSFENQSDQIEIKKISLPEIEHIRKTSPTDIYLCGGGQLAGWLLQNKQIDLLKIKLNPVVLGSGKKLFDGIEAAHHLKLNDSKVYSDGMQVLTYELLY